jgi:hypothetical protein
MNGLDFGGRVVGIRFPARRELWLLGFSFACVEL